MKKIHWIGVLFVTFALGLLATIFWMKFNSPKYTFAEVVSANISETELCDLVNSPEKFDGKIIRFKTTVWSNIHGYYLSDGRCRGQGDSGIISISINEKVRENTWKEIENQRGNDRHKPLAIDTIGIFKYEQTKGGTDSIVDRTSLHFEIYKIEFLTELPK